MFEEGPEEAWARRYGARPPLVAPDVSSFLNHRSVRRFRDEVVEESLVEWLVACAQSAATSSNLQLWSMVSVQDPDRRAEVSRLCDNQKQVLYAPWFFAFVLDHHRLRSAAQQADEQCLGLDYNEFFTMGVIDVALAAERLVCAAEHIGLGTCYIGALRNDPAGVKELLRLPVGCVGLFGLCLGWPSEPAKPLIKPRFRQDDVWFRESYGKPSADEFNQRMRDFYTEQGMSTDHTWSKKSGIRVDEHHLTGREVLKSFLTEQGLDKR